MMLKRLSLGLLALTIGSVIGTQVFAYQARYHPTLGTPLLEQRMFPPTWSPQGTGMHRVYTPAHLYLWAWRWGWQAPRTFQGAALSLLSVTALLGLPLRRREKTPPLSARWATRRDLKAAGLFAHEGIVLGKAYGKIIRHIGSEHSLCVGPSRSGKGTCHVVPTLLEWRESVFVFDPKQELCDLTAGYRETISQVRHLHPTSATSDRFNPLDGVRLGTVHEIRDAGLIASILTDPDGDGDRGGASQHFRELATDFLTGLIIHGLLNGRPHLAALNSLLTMERSFDELLKTMQRSTHPAVLRAAKMVGDLADRELSGVLSTARRGLALWADPLVARMTECSDYVWTDLRREGQPMSLYLSIPFADQDRLRPLSRLLVRQMLDHVTLTLSGWGQRLLVVLDEVASLKRMPILAEGLEYLAGYGVKLMLVTPSLTPLEALYGTRNGFWEGCRIRLVFAPNSMAMASLFARETGEQLVKKERVSVTREPFHTFRDRTSTSTETTREPLLSPTALMQLDPDDVLLLVGNSPPALIHKAKYYENISWARRVALAKKEPTP
jgi:type IV secretion system protein VirD4